MLLFNNYSQNFKIYRRFIVSIIFIWKTQLIISFFYKSMNTIIIIYSDFYNKNYYNRIFNLKFQNITKINII